jgi:hypothetical protein
MMLNYLASVMPMVPKSHDEVVGMGPFRPR